MSITLLNLGCFVPWEDYDNWGEIPDEVGQQQQPTESNPTLAWLWGLPCPGQDGRGHYSYFTGNAVAARKLIAGAQGQQNAGGVGIGYAHGTCRPILDYTVVSNPEYAFGGTSGLEDEVPSGTYQTAVGYEWQLSANALRQLRAILDAE